MNPARWPITFGKGDPRISDVSQVCITLSELNGNFEQAVQSYPFVLTY